ncbi:T9SS type A sorting domain-containing protein [Empedobacter brevis]|uniref:T9SS type A sorting domain-containing protein n=1 Tax=Empedobacter brevis TaxID=247 RepID=UPI00289CF3CC|nr:T9SS type A sorting domain-containing protein [Empedobacter brevis]
MVKHLLTIFLSTFIFAQEQEYIPMSKENNAWKYNMKSLWNQCELSPNKIEYTLSTGDTQIINGIAYRAIYRQFDFISREFFLQVKNCDRDQKNSNYFTYLNENNYNDRILVAYIRDENKKVYVRQLHGYEEEHYDFSKEIATNPNPYNMELFNISSGIYYNIQTREFYWGVMRFGRFSRIVEGVGYNESEFIYAADNGYYSGNFYIDLIGFSTDGGQSYYKLNNEFLKVDKLEKSKTYKITENPVKNVLSLNTVKGIQEISIIDNNGRIILQKNKNFDKLNVAQLTIGKYYLVITTNQQKETLSFLKK